MLDSIGDLERITPNIGHSFRVLRWSDNLREVDLLLDTGDARRISGVGDRWHYHSEMELIVFTGGEGTFYAGDYIGPLITGTAALLGENLPHHWNVRGSCAGLLVQWSFPPEHAFWGFPETLPLTGLFKRSRQGICYGGRTAAAVTSGLQEMARASRPLDQLYLFLRLLSLLASAPGPEQTLLSRHLISLSARSNYQQRISEAVRYLLANFRNEMRLDEVLRITRMRKRTFSRQFKRHLGRTFSEFVTHLRLQAASRELVETDRSVLEIACSCGFTDISFFNRIFRRILRCSPSKYRTRKRHRPKHPV